MIVSAILGAAAAALAHRLLLKSKSPAATKVRSVIFGKDPGGGGGGGPKEPV